MSLRSIFFLTRTLVLLSIVLDFRAAAIMSVSSECGRQARLTNGNLTIRYVRPETGYRLGEELVLLGSVRWRSVR
jgi:hypothetical protein